MDMSATITREELKARIDRGERFKLVETLPQAAFEKAHLPGAINLPLDRLTDLAPRVLPDKGADIVVYCARAT
jgi:rhodanese-related sulfurtransferase